MLEKLREKIDQIDDELLKLFNERIAVVQEVGRFKRTTQAPIYRPEREKAIIDRLSKTHKGPLTKAAIEAIFLEIFAISRNYELPERIAYLGPDGSFTHQAAESRYGAISDYIALDSISAVFESVATGRVKYGVVPIENNQEGTVQETIDYLGTHQLSIVAEMALPIHFSIATLEEDLSQVTTIFSRDIAFRQCKNFINDYFDHKVKLVPVSSTSRACQMTLKEKNSAAICAPIAAREYKVPILYNNIQDSADNTTRFLILSENFYNQPSGEDKTSLIAKLPDPTTIDTFEIFLLSFTECLRYFSSNLFFIKSKKLFSSIGSISSPLVPIPILKLFLLSIFGIRVDIFFKPIFLDKK